jgi:NAD(P)-dependent dehydrogenase (short-subunit alcohol dehydrogenase family)
VAGARGAARTPPLIPAILAGMAFHQKVAIVTGAASGIGRALAQELCARGAVVVAADINFPGVDALTAGISAGGGKAFPAQVDVADAAQVRLLVEQTAAAQGRVDLLFNNAGIGVAGEVRHLTLEDWRKVIDINLMGVIYGVAAAYPLMLRQRSGHIVNISSLAGLIWSPGLAPYAATKSAVVALSTALRAEAEDLGVRVSVVCPGFVATSIFENAVGVKYDKRLVLDKIRLPLMPPDRAARAILRGVERNRALIVFPANARLLAALHRISPALLRFFRRRIVQGLRGLERR